MDYFTADTHFNHGKIIKFCNRPFSSVKEMNETIIKNINLCCSRKDKLWIVGDFGFVGVKTTEEIISRLNPHVCIIQGNHDLPPRKLFKAGAHDVYTHNYLKINGEMVLLSHYPYYPSKFKIFLNKIKGLNNDLYEYRLQDRGLWLIHGHTHNHEKSRVIKKQINVGVDNWDFKPVSEKTIIKIMNGKYK